MKFFRRLICCFVVVLVALFSASSFASFYSSGGFNLKDGAAVVGIYSSAGAACQASVGYFTPFAAANQFPLTASLGTGTQSSTCTLHGTYSSWYFSVNAVTSGACPVNSTVAAGDCACNNSFHQNGSSSTTTACVVAQDLYCNAKSGKSAGQYTYPLASGESVTGAKGTHLCEFRLASDNLLPLESPGCAMSVVYTMGAPGFKVGNATYSGSGCNSDSVSDGSSALVGDANSVAGVTAGLTGGAAPDLCSPGSVPGTVNGLAVCSPLSDINVMMAGPSSTATAPSGSASSPTSGLGGNAPPTATSESSSTTCAAGSCTTTITFNNSVGAVVGTSTASQTVAQFCAASPNAAICGSLPAGGAGGAAGAAGAAGDGMSKFCTDNPTAAACKKTGDSTWAGTCGTAPACSGDAIQCAIAAADFQSSCLLKTALSPDTDTASVYNKAADGSDGINTDTMKAAAHGSAVNVGSFNQAGSNWGRACPADPVINISWGTVSAWTLPLSRVCSPLEILAQAAVGITLLGSLVWVIGGSKS